MRCPIFSGRTVLQLGLLLGVVTVSGCGDSSGPAAADDGADGGGGGDDASTVPGADGGTAPVTDGGTGPTGTDGGSAPVGEGGASGITTVFTIVFENHDYNEVVGSTNAPFFNSLITKYGLATAYMDSGTHPSLPNYLTLISGDPQYGGVVDEDPTGTFSSFPKDAPNLGAQLETAKIAWRSYQESMGTACNLTAVGDYAPKHDPFLYFKDTQTPTTLCASRNVDYSGFAADLAGGTFRYMWITPNLTSDGHNPVDLLGTASNPPASLTASDTWAKTEIGKIMASPAYLNGGVIFITWDEAEGRNGNSKDQVPMIVVSERIKTAGMKSANPYSHKSYLATVEDILGLPRLTTVAGTPNMFEFFK